MSNGTPMNNMDNRRYARYEILDYALVESDHFQEPIRSVIVDIGLGGLQLRSKVALPVGTQCLLKLGNMESAPVTIRGEIRHIQPVEGSDLVACGVKFVPENHEERSTVAEYVHSVFQRQADNLIN